MIGKLATAILATTVLLAHDAKAQIYTIQPDTGKVIAGAKFENPGTVPYTVTQSATQLSTTISGVSSMATIDARDARLPLDVEISGKGSVVSITGDKVQVHISGDYVQADFTGTKFYVEHWGSFCQLTCGGKDCFLLLAAGVYGNEISAKGERNTVYLDWTADRNTTVIIDDSNTSVYHEDGINYPWYDNVAYYNGVRVS